MPGSVALSSTFLFLQVHVDLATRSLLLDLLMWLFLMDRISSPILPGVKRDANTALPPCTSQDEQFNVVSLFNGSIHP